MDKNYVSSGEVKVGLVCVTDIRRLNLNTLTKKNVRGIRVDDELCPDRSFRPAREVARRTRWETLSGTGRDHRMDRRVA